MPKLSSLEGKTLSQRQRREQNAGPIYEVYRYCVAGRNQGAYLWKARIVRLSRLFRCHSRKSPLQTDISHSFQIWEWSNCFLPEMAWKFLWLGVPLPLRPTWRRLWSGSPLLPPRSPWSLKPCPTPGPTQDHHHPCCSAWRGSVDEATRCGQYPILCNLFVIIVANVPLKWRRWWNKKQNESLTIPGGPL